MSDYTNQNGVSLSTPFTQKYGNNGGNKTLADLVREKRDEYILCQETDLPKMEVMDSDSLFICPCRHIVNTFNDRFYMWFLTTPGGKDIIHGFNYPYVEVCKDSWIMKVDVTALSLKSENYLYEIKYFQPTDHIELTEIPYQNKPNQLRILPYNGNAEQPFSKLTPDETFEKYIFPMLQSIGLSKRDLQEGDSI